MFYRPNGPGIEAKIFITPMGYRSCCYICCINVNMFVMKEKKKSSLDTQQYFVPTNGVFGMRQNVHKMFKFISTSLSDLKTNPLLNVIHYNSCLI